MTEPISTPLYLTGIPTLGPFTEPLSTARTGMLFWNRSNTPLFQRCYDGCLQCLEAGSDVCAKMSTQGTAVALLRLESFIAVHTFCRLLGHYSHCEQ